MARGPVQGNKQGGDNTGEMKACKTEVLAWWSGGVASALACKWAVDTFKNVRVIFIDTFNEDADTYRFLQDCERVYGKKIEIVYNEKYQPNGAIPPIEQVWYKYNSLNTANGAICSSELKREVRFRIQKSSNFFAQVFGFDSSERDRHNNMRKNYPETNCISPMIDLGYSKDDCAAEVISWGIQLPRAYIMGYRNNNCVQTGCVQGGVGYWKKRKIDFPTETEHMAGIEHDLTARKGKPVTVLRIRIDGEMHPCFLRKHPDYPYHLDMAKGRDVKPLTECTGFCSTKDIQVEIDFETMKEIEEL